jgi:hypothetical protein
MYVRNLFKEVKTIVTETLASTTVSTASVLNTTGNVSATVVCTTGNVWINPLITATTANSIKLIEGQALDLIIPGSLSLISDSTEAFYQAILWKD